MVLVGVFLVLMYAIESQIADCEQHCLNRGYVIVERYVDKEKYRVRGTLTNPSDERKDRPAYRRRLKDARAGRFDVIVAWKEDRLYRGMYAAMPLSELLDEMGKRIAAELVKENFDPKMLGIKAALGKIERDNIRERMIMGRRARLERGEVPGGDQVRYGYKKVNKRCVIHEEEAAVVRQIFEWYIEGSNNLEIRQRLNEAGVPPRRGKRWAKSSIIRILGSEFYASGQISTVLDAETFQIPCTQIITRKTWHEAQKVRKQNKYPVRHIKEDYLCAGLVYCACGWQCQSKAHCANANRGYTKVTGRYVCPRRQHMPEDMPEDCAPTTSSKKVDMYVWSFIKRVLRQPEALRKQVDRKLSELRARQGDLEAEAERIQTRMDELTMERQWVITQARKGRITDEDMDMQLAALQIQEPGYRKDLEERRVAEAIGRQVDALSQWEKEYLTGLGAAIEVLDKDPAKMPKTARDELYQELKAWQYKDKYPDDEMAQLRWAILEEKRRIVRMLIEKVVVAKLPNRKRKITPVLAFEISVQSAGAGAGLEDRARSEYRNSGD